MAAPEAPPMKILFIHNFYQQFGGEDSVALSERHLLETHGHEVLFWTRHNDEIKNYGIADKAEFFPETIYSRRTVSDITEAVGRFKPDLAYVHNVYPLISPSLYYTLHGLRVPMVQVFQEFSSLPKKVYYLSDDAIQLRQFCDYLVDALKQGRAWRVPPTLIRAMGWAGDVLERLGVHAPINSIQARELTTNFPIPIQPTIELTHCVTDYASAAAKTVKWALESQSFATGVGHNEG